MGFSLNEEIGEREMNYSTYGEDVRSNGDGTGKHQIGKRQVFSKHNKF